MQRRGGVKGPPATFFSTPTPRRRHGFGAVSEQQLVEGIAATRWGTP
jgi:hypothetical protein